MANDQTGDNATTPSELDNTRILIAGAGVGGLTLATLLARSGFPVEVFEQASQPSDVGAGIQLGPNALNILDALNVLAPLAVQSVQPSHAKLKAFDSGKTLLSTPLNPHCQSRYGQPYFHIHRADLIDTLLTAASQAGAHVHFGHAVNAVEQCEDRVCVSAGSTERSGRLLVGADGIRSTVRSRVFGDDRPSFTGQTAWRALVSTQKLSSPALSKDAHVWIGPGRHVVAYYVRGGELVNIVAVSERTHWVEEGWHVNADTNQLRATFSGWDPTVTALLDEVTECYHWGLFDRPVPERWYRGRVLLLGDACHPMLPFMAQGAAMSLEDAWVLADELINPNASVSQVCQSYQQRRRSRVQRVHAQSTRNALTYHRHPGWKSTLRNQSFRLAARFPALTHAVLDPIYGADLTAKTP